MGELGECREMAKTEGPSPRPPQKPGINWQRQGIILLVSCGIALFMVTRQIDLSTGLPYKAAPSSATEALKKGITASIDMRQYEIVEGTNHVGKHKFLIISNTKRPPTVAAEFMYDRSKRAYSATILDEDLSDMRSSLQKQKLLMRD